MHLFTLRTLLNAIIRCLQLNTNGELGMTTWRWIISHRRCWITVYVFCRNAHMNIIVIIMSYICIVMRSIFCQLPSCNLFTQHVSYLLWRDTTSELWTPVHSFTLIIQPTAIIVPFHSLQLNTIFHTIRLILCFQQARKIDTLPVSLGQSSLIVLCAGSTSTAELPSTRKYFSGTVDNLQKCFLLLLDLITLVSY
jgi:hypothetical protein